ARRTAQGCLRRASISSGRTGSIGSGANVTAVLDQDCRTRPLPQPPPRSGEGVGGGIALLPLSASGRGLGEGLPCSPSPLRGGGWGRGCLQGPQPLPLPGGSFVSGRDLPLPVSA